MILPMSTKPGVDTTSLGFMVISNTCSAWLHAYFHVQNQPALNMEVKIQYTMGYNFTKSTRSYREQKPHELGSSGAREQSKQCRANKWVSSMSERTKGRASGLVGYLHRVSWQLLTIVKSLSGELASFDTAAELSAVNSFIDQAPKWTRCGDIRIGGISKSYSQGNTNPNITKTAGFIRCDCFIVTYGIIWWLLTLKKNDFRRSKITRDGTTDGRTRSLTEMRSSI